MAELLSQDSGPVTSQKGNTLAWKIYFLGLCILAAGLPLSMFLMSISQFILLGAWVLDGNLKNKLRAFYNNKPALVISGLFILHVVGLVHTSNLDFGLNDLRIKLPLLILPLVMSGFPKLQLWEFRRLVWVFISAVILSSLVSVLILVEIIPIEINNVRDISIFISHIRLSLLVCIAIFILGWMIRDAGLQGEMKRKIMLSLPVIWLTAFLILLESVTGIGILIIVSIVIAAIRVFTTRRKWPSVLFLIFIFSLVAYTSAYIQSVYERVSYYAPVSDDEMQSSSKEGCKYVFDAHDHQFENGHKVWAFICWEELEESWSERSEMDFDAKDKRNQDLKITLLRFMSSKGLKKDREGIHVLTDEEIRQIEMGIANCNYVGRGNIFVRLDQIVWEYHRYRMTGNPSGHSVTQRLEYWNAAAEIVNRNKMAGVGTGDSPQAYEEEYIRNKTILSESWRLRAHNQYLAIGVALGIPGLLYFVFFLVYPGLVSGKFKDLLFLCFWITAVLSMLTEDTLETQAGVTFLTFFYCLFLLMKQDDPMIMVQSES